MKTLKVIVFLLVVFASSAQSYVDLGIRHFGVGEYDEALEDFREAEQIMSMITESSKAKVYYYRGMIWLDRAEKEPGKYAEHDPLKLSFNDLKRVTSMDPSWSPQVEDAYKRLYALIIAEADSYIKLEKKEDELSSKLDLLNSRINYLSLADELAISSNPQLLLGTTNKQAGDLIFANSSNVVELQKAKEYYDEALKHFELARYEDPFSKEIIRDLLTLSRRLADEERIKEYEELLRLAGG